MKASKPIKQKAGNGRGKMSGNYAKKQLQETIKRLNLEMGLTETYGRNLRVWK